MKITKMHHEEDYSPLSKKKSITFKKWIEQWIEEIKVGLAPTTKSMYQGRIKTSLIPDLGHYKLDELTVIVLRKYINSLYEDGARRDGKEGGLSPRTVKDIRDTLRNALNDAVKEGLIKENPMDKIQIKKIPDSEPPILKPEQAQVLINVAKSHRLYPALLLEMATGLRRGEILGLRWENVDLNEGYITVKESIVKGWGTASLKASTKTKGSQRIVPIPEVVIEELKKHKVRMLEEEDTRKKNGTEWLGTDYVFCATNGNYTSPNTFSKIWARWRKEAGIPDIKFHGLRHNALSLMIDQGIDLRTVMSVSGHTQIKTLMQTYAHVINPTSKKVANTMGKLLEGVL